MPDVNSDQKAKAKAAAANAAVALNDTAVVLGGAAVVTAAAGAVSGAGAPAGVLVGGVLAIGSFGAWLIANRYQRLANDPPRTDYDQLWQSSASLNENSVPSDEPLATAHRLAAHFVILADAVDALVTSLERYDGAIAANDEDSASKQLDAVKQNAQAAIREHGVVADIAGSLNQAWSQGSYDWSSQTIAQAQDFYRKARGDDPANAPGDPLKSVFASVSNVAEAEMFSGMDFTQDPIFLATGMPAQPKVLMDSICTAALANLSDPLSALVEDNPPIA
jgi:hypothetical protein